MSRRALVMWVVWTLALAGVTALLLVFRARLDKAHVILVFLLVILGASAAGGRALGVVLSLAAFVIFDLLFLPPYGTLVVRNPLDWLALVAFLITSLVAAQLLYMARAQRAAVEREVAAREGERLKDALLAAVSHDLRTPLTSIKGLAHELSQDGDERAAIIEEEADRLNRLVTDLLDAATMSAGNFPVAPQSNALDDLLGVVVRQFAGRADRNRLEVSLDRPDELVIGVFDFVQTLRIVTNLVENALKYSPVDAHVQITGGAEGGRMVVRISDRGPGIVEHGESRALERQHDAARSVSAGLGLSIARGLAAAQGGNVEYQRRAGGGSVFTLFLPLAQ
jgi:K+-sensing histidine kinase KdpD